MNDNDVHPDADCGGSCLTDASTLTDGSSAVSEADSPGIAPGAVIGDRYEIRERVGKGGMGEVWRAFDLRLQVEVALKSAPLFFAPVSPS